MPSLYNAADAFVLPTRFVHRLLLSSLVFSSFFTFLFVVAARAGGCRYSKRSRWLYGWRQLVSSVDRRICWSIRTRLREATILGPAVADSSQNANATSLWGPLPFLFLLCLCWFSAAFVCVFLSLQQRTEAQKKGKQARRDILRKYTPQIVTLQLVERLADILNEQTAYAQASRSWAFQLCSNARSFSFLIY
jgi:hypothetical protein